jgi:TBC1 domain family member 8/9
MYGTLLDQKVFESLVEKTMPVLWEHLSKNDVQLSVVSLPWFLSLYINSMPLIFAFRVLDVFFLEGPKVLFQVGLAILRINGEELLDASDDGTFISVLKSYFARLGESAHPKSENPKHRAITNFQALMVVAFKEFDGITQHTISEQRSKHKAAVLDNIESFAKRTSIRNLGPESKKLSTNDLGFLYDRFYTVLYERQQRAQLIQAENDRKAKAARQRASEIVTGVPGNTPEMGRIGLGPSTTEMDYDAFREFLAGISKWAVTDSPTSPTKDDSAHKGPNGYFHTLRAKPINTSPWGSGPEPADHEFLKRLFKKWDVEANEALSLQSVVSGLAPIKGNRDIMSNISYFFELYDDDSDGKVDREGILRMSEALLFLSRRGVPDAVSPSPSSASMHDGEVGPDGKRRENKDEQFLSAVSAFIRRCFEYADPDHPSRQAEKEASAAAENVDLLDLNDEDKSTSNPLETPPTDAKDNSQLARASTNSFGQTKAKHAAANAALDPASPVHITLPTFRMLVLADETLESFFDSGFANSFHLADAPLPSSTITSPSFLGLQSASPHPGASPSVLPALSPGGAGAGIVPPGKGLRGMLDNIVTDGMRFTAEVRRRMDEAQKELDRGATTRGTEDDDDDEGDEGGRDLLEGAEADAGREMKSEHGERAMLDKGLVSEPGGRSPGAASPAPSEVEKSTMFER